MYVWVCDVLWLQIPIRMTTPDMSKHELKTQVCTHVSQLSPNTPKQKMNCAGMAKCWWEWNGFTALFCHLLQHNNKGVFVPKTDFVEL